MATEKPKRYKSPGTDQTAAELMTAYVRPVRSEIH